MNSILQNHWTKVVLALLAILVAIYVANPPSSPCQTEVEQFQESNKNLAQMYRKSKKRCQEDFTIGGCVEYFELLANFNRKVKDVSGNCSAELKDETSVKAVIPEGIKILVSAAWGTKPPDALAQRNGFLEQAQVTIFCRLKKTFQNIWGEESWNSYANQLMSDLPGASAMPRNDVWGKTILSDRCAFVD